MKVRMNRTGRLALKEVAAVAAMVAALGAPLTASALSLGRLSVQSSLGESLKAEIDVTSLTPDEASNLRVRVAPPDAYRIAGVDYNPVLPATNVTVQRRADGSAFLRILSDRPVQEPFVDVILELSWSSGRLLREYTLLFDPPAIAKAPVAPATRAGRTDQRRDQGAEQGHHARGGGPGSSRGNTCRAGPGAISGCSTRPAGGSSGGGSPAGPACSEGGRTGRAGERIV